MMVWDRVAAAVDGKPTTKLTGMASRWKDNRLLPMEWQATGPHAKITAPIGSEGNLDPGILMNIPGLG